MDWGLVGYLVMMGWIGCWLIGMILLASSKKYTSWTLYKAYMGSALKEPVDQRYITHRHLVLFRRWAVIGLVIGFLVGQLVKFAGIWITSLVL